MAMKHDLNDLFRQRFQGHEAPVPPGTWQGIQAQMTVTVAPVEGGDKVADLFHKRFQGHEMAVDPAVWQGISAQLGHAVVGGSAIGGAWGWVAAGIGALAIGAAGVFLLGGLPGEEELVRTQALEQQEALPAAGPEEAPILATDQHIAEEVVERPRPVPQRTPVREGTADQELPVAVPPAPEDPPAVDMSAPAVYKAEQNPELVHDIISEMTAQADAAFEAEKVERAKAPGDEPQEPGAHLDPEPRTSEQPDLFLPNTFTPNGDGLNDVYTVGGVEYFAQVMVRAYSVKDNRLVFSSNSNEAWHGNECEEGYYLVAVEAVTHDGRLVTEGKVVFLNRNRLN